MENRSEIGNELRRYMESVEHSIELDKEMLKSDKRSLARLKRALKRLENE